MWSVDPRMLKNVSSFIYLHLTLPPTMISYEMVNVGVCQHSKQESSRWNTIYLRQFVSGLSATQKLRQEGWGMKFTKVQRPAQHSFRYSLRYFLFSVRVRLNNCQHSTASDAPHVKLLFLVFHLNCIRLISCSRLYNSKITTQLL